MRETKVQTIARLERKLAEKEAELKEVKRLSRADKRDSKAYISDLQKAYKREILLLKNHIAQIQSVWSEEKNKLMKEIESLESYKNYYRDRVQEKDNADNNWASQYKSSDLLLRQDNDVRLEYFLGGFYCDKWQQPFVDPLLLTLTINPYTGERLNIDGTVSILNQIKENPFYVQRVEDMKPYYEIASQESEEGIDALVHIDEVGREIYKNLYLDFPFEEYSI